MTTALAKRPVANKTITKATPKAAPTKAAPKTKAELPVNDQIEALIDDLNATDDQLAKKKIRARLRRLGHFGASRTPAKPMTKDEAKAYVTKHATTSPAKKANDDDVIDE